MNVRIIIIYMKNVFLTLLLLFQIILANQPVGVRPRDITWISHSPIVIAFVIILFVLAIIAIIVGIILQEKKRKEKLEKHSEYQFLKQCERFGLSANEIFSLRNYLLQANIKSFPSVFNSVSIFEEAIDRECNVIKKKWGVTAKAESATLIIKSIRRKLGYDRLLPEIPLQSTRNFEVGQKVDLFPRIDSDSKIENAVVLESSELVLNLHFNPKKAEFNPIDKESLVIVYKRKADGIYTVETPIVEVDMSSTTIKVLQTADIHRKQYRDNIRMSFDIPLKCRLLHRQKATKSTPLGKLAENSVILDLSGGGLAFISDTEFKLDDTLSLSFKIGQRQIITKGKVVGINNVEVKNEIRYKHRVAFINIKQADADAIIKFIFEKQREQMHVNF